MNDQEKSDSGVVAKKSPNKAGFPVAEVMEPRPEIKGNAGQRSTLRTQGRARVTQALDRVRQAARQGKKEKFTALLHHINVDTFRLAFYALKRKAAAGVDGVTWQDYEADLDAIQPFNDIGDFGIGDTCESFAPRNISVSVKRQRPPWRVGALRR